MDSRKRLVRAGRMLLCLAMLLAVVGLHTTEGTASSVRTVGVVDFYAVAPLGSFQGSVPEQFAADDLSGLLTRAGGDRVGVISRGVVRQVEASIGWQNEDVLRFGRLEALAHGIGADRLVIGWITMLNVDTGGSEDGGPPRVDVSVVVQVFDPAQGRIVAETRRSDSSLLFGTRMFLAEYGLHLALSPTIPSLVTTLAETPWAGTVLPRAPRWELSIRLARAQKMQRLLQYSNGQTSGNRVRVY